MRREALTGSTAVAVQRPAVASGLLDLQRRGQNSWQEDAFATRAEPWLFTARRGK